jgi:hypothetical protein
MIKGGWCVDEIFILSEKLSKPKALSTLRFDESMDFRRLIWLNAPAGT